MANPRLTSQSPSESGAFNSTSTPVPQALGPMMPAKVSTVVRAMVPEKMAVLALMPKPEKCLYLRLVNKWILALSKSTELKLRKHNKIER